jgi:hypothetical protein
MACGTSWRLSAQQQVCVQYGTRFMPSTALGRSTMHAADSPVADHYLCSTCTTSRSLLARSPQLGCSTEPASHPPPAAPPQEVPAWLQRTDLLIGADNITKLQDTKVLLWVPAAAAATHTCTPAHQAGLCLFLCCRPATATACWPLTADATCMPTALANGHQWASHAVLRIKTTVPDAPAAAATQGGPGRGGQLRS